MSRFNKIFLSIFLLIAVGLTYLEAIEPEPINWNPSYSAADKIPMGTFVLFESLKRHFPSVKIVDRPAYEYLTSETPEGTFVFINNHLPFDNAELELLLDWVRNGNRVFASADALSKNLLDSLDLNVSTLVPAGNLVSKPLVNLTNPGLQGEEAFLFNRETYHSVFSEIDTLKHTVLGVSQLYDGNKVITEPEVNFIKVPFGTGEFYLHTTPQVFSNYFILEENNAAYIENALAYLPKEGALYWDEYEKAGKVFQTSLLYVLMENKALKWAYYIVLAGCLLFVLFEGKRKQRSIPVIKPLENQTYNFTRTVAGMYLDRKDFKGIATKKVNLFLDYIRTHYRIPTETIDEEFYLAVSVQSESTLEEVKKLFQQIKMLESKSSISKNELKELNSAIEEIKKTK